MKLFTSILVLCLYANAYASIQKTELNLTRLDAVCIALKNNLELRAIKANIDIANGSLEQSGQLENPELGLSYGNDFLFNNENEDAFSISISQKFPLFGRLSKEKDIAKIDIELAKLEYAQARRNLAQQVEIDYINCLKLSEFLENNKKQLELLNDLKNYLHSIYKKGEASQLDYFNALNEYEMLDIKLAENSLGLEVALLELKALLGLDIEKNIKLKDSLSIINTEDNEFNQAVLNSRLDYQILTLSQKSIKAQIALISSQKYEDIEVGIFFETARSVDNPVGLTRESAMGISLSVPLPFKSTQGAISEQLATRKKIETLSLDKELQIKKEIKIYSMRASKYEEIAKEKHADLLSKSQNLNAHYLEAYKTAKASLMEVFSASQAHLDIIESSLDAKAQQSINSIKLKYSLGIFEYEK